MLSIDGRLRDSLIRKKNEFDALKHKHSAAAQSVHAGLKAEFIYNSNAIGQRFLTLSETARVISEGAAIKGRSLDDHLAVRVHENALGFIEMCAHKKRGVISERTLCEIHAIIMRDTAGAGAYRTAAAQPYGPWHRPPSAGQVAGDMKNLFAWYRDKHKYLTTVECAALFHHKLLNIHPFTSGNGKAARLFLNLQLVREGYPLIVILRNDAKKYCSALKAADRGTFGPLVKFMTQAVVRSLDMYLKNAGGPSKANERFITLAKLSKRVPYSAKYLNLLVREGKLEAHKDGRNWLSSVEAMRRYLDTRQRKR
ncbi:MAG: Fic family protein [Candidatus Omnitrophica bacterium]|nr:Fic family protein [Candidatus Omnitrophota bacterium]